MPHLRAGVAEGLPGRCSCDDGGRLAALILKRWRMPGRGSQGGLLLWTVGFSGWGRTSMHRLCCAGNLLHRRCGGRALMSNRLASHKADEWRE